MSRYRILFIEEINARSQLKPFTVRFIGKLRNYLAENNVGILVDTDVARPISVRVDFQNIVDIPMIIGSYYQIIGEALCEHVEPVIIRAAFVKNVDGIDMNMYKEAVRSRREYLFEFHLLSFSPPR
ncbi:uncharacterized protein NPIL_127811 [Nephila pilipes]|uniref:Uncharacterized protein n=1 Tax=Nephila pilipes TaxID=299642 RepID=A0A8X6TLC6_NEPPI|nr:uncharacterized protein NPIL_127811 [Nephila pilipes]